MATLLGNAYIRVRPDTSGFQKEAEGKLRGATAALGAVVKNGLLAGGAVLAAAGAIGLKTAANLETARIGFVTMLGDARKADSFLRDLAKFAEKTPFAFPELQQSASKLISVGTEARRVIPIMTVLGDSTSAMGTGADGINRAVLALQQMRVKGKVTGEEMLQLAEAGVPAWEALATQLGVTTAKAQEMVTAGKVSVDDLFTAIETRQGATLKRTAGMMDAQSKTISGLWSTLKDTVSMRLAEMWAPLTPTLGRALAAVTVWADDALGAATHRLGGIVDYVSTTLVPSLKTAWGNVSATFGDIKARIAFGDIKARIAFGDIARDARDAAKTAVQPLIDGFTSGMASGNWQPFGVALGNAIRNALSALGSVASDLAEKVGEIADKVDWVGLGIEIGRKAVPFILGLAAGLLNFDMKALWDGIVKHWPTILMGVITVAFAPAKLVAPLVKILGKIPFVGKLLAWGVKAINDFGGKLLGWAGGLFAKFGKGFSQGIGKTGPGIIGALRGFFDDVWTRVYVWGDDAIKWVKGIPGRIGEALERLGVKVGQGMGKLGSWVVKKLREMARMQLEILRLAAREAWDAFRRVAGDRVANIVKWLLTRPKAFADTLLSLPAKLRAKAGSAWDAFAKTTRDKVGSIVSWLKGVPGKAADALKNLGAKLGGKALEGARRVAGDINRYLVGNLNKVTTKFNVTIPSIPRFAKGGEVPGSWGTRGRDSVPALLMPDEHVWTTREVNGAGGHAAVERLRSLAASGKLRGYKSGGRVREFLGDAADLGRRVRDKVNDWVMQGAGFATDAALKPIMGALRSRIGSAPAIPNGFVMGTLDKFASAARSWGKDQDASGGTLGGGALGGSGVARMMAILRGRFPGLPLNSGFRPGSITATGNRSYHSMGRAVDVPPRMDVFNWIRQHYGRTTKELIFSPAGGRQIHNGSPHMYSGITRAMHFNHVHWAYDKGGLARGMGLMPKATSRPERVLSPRQTAAFEKAMDRGFSGPEEFSFRLFIGGKEVEAVAERVVDRRERQLARQLKNGRR